MKHRHLSSHTIDRRASAHGSVGHQFESVLGEVWAIAAYGVRVAASDSMECLRRLVRTRAGHHRHEP